MATIDLAGKRFGRFTVLRKAPSRGPHAHWFCRCDCGNERDVRAQNLRNGNSSSCGCYSAEVHRQLCIDRTMHGHSRRAKRSRAHIAWMNMIQRCTNPNNGAYHNYGGRGISVCDRWLDFTHFLADMGDPPPRLTIERNDGDGNYEPGNCRWATRKEQMNNLRRNRVIEFDGLSMTLQQWSERIGMNIATLRDRIVQNGWPIAEALTQPLSAVRLKNRR